MAKIKQNIIILILLSCFGANAQELVLGAEKINEIINSINNKNVAIVANQTSVVKNTHLVDTLTSLNQNIMLIFSPEHGFRGEADAGENIKDGVDTKTGIPILSLHGKHKKPTKESLENIDIIIFDIQDVGARFYTYISTLHYILEAASEQGIQVIVLDRPNPNGHYIDGPILEEKYKSFVGKHPIPIVHGMTIGEYAKMIIGEKWIEQNCNLKIIKMENYNRENIYDLPIKPSPNLPNKKAINLYPSLCLFERTTISIGRGTDYPFQHFGAPFLENNYSFTPVSGEGSKYPKHENKICFGIDLRFQKKILNSINLDWIIECYNKSSEKENFFTLNFDKLAGTDKLRLKIISGMSAEKISETWKEGLVEFQKIREKYLLY
ncbi:MAG: exo-beta-N-acetylmuramidase NamZ family protein [Flavobacteriales bacterium]|jgi:uncharacterized protein YbbC (DUF1343 family)|tara:strand:- start:180 stop:1319 length:1140 start_codon:yes stop_codon:yes gene_type:complete